MKKFLNMTMISFVLMGHMQIVHASEVCNLLEQIETNSNEVISRMAAHKNMTIGIIRTTSQTMVSPAFETMSAQEQTQLQELKDDMSFGRNRASVFISKFNRALLSVGELKAWHSCP